MPGMRALWWVVLLLVMQALLSVQQQLRQVKIPRNKTIKQNEEKTGGVFRHLSLFLSDCKRSYPFPAVPAVIYQR